MNSFNRFKSVFISIVILCSILLSNAAAQEKIQSTKYQKANVDDGKGKIVTPNSNIEKEELQPLQDSQVYTEKLITTRVVSKKALIETNPSSALNPLSQTLFYGNTPSYYTYGTTNTNYVSGTNISKDQGKYQRFNFTGSAVVSEVRIYFCIKSIVGSADNFNLVIKSVGTDGAPSTTLYTKTYSTSVIDVSNWGVTYNSFPINPSINVTSAFFVGIEWDPNIDDRFAIVSDNIGEGNNQKRAWERWYSGTYHSVHEVYDNGTHNVDFWFTAIIDPVTIPSAPILSQPSNSSPDVSTNPTLSWNASTGAASYRLQISDNSNFSTTVFDQSSITSTSQQVTGLLGNTTYYWRVNATNSAGTSSWSSTWNFTTQPTSVNLTPYKPNGWSDKIVVSTTQGDIIGATAIYNNQNIYVNWAVINSGTASTGVSFYNDLFVDGTKVHRWEFQPPMNPNDYGPITDFSIGNLSAGEHTIQITSDVTNLISETNESDNSYTKTITVLQPDNPRIQVTPTSLTINQPSADASLKKSSRAITRYDSTLNIPKINQELIIGSYVDENGNRLEVIKVPGRPPKNFRAAAAKPSLSAVTLTNIPAYDWSFGCSPTSGAMIAGYYDNHGYPNMYTGPTNNGIAPMNNSSWGSVVINGETLSQCPLSASRNGVDGLTVKGHVDDYWIRYGSCDPDPYITNGWQEHSDDNCIGDFMKTNQSEFNNCDGATSFIYNDNYNKTIMTEDGDGCYGLKEFFESRGYTVQEYYSQYIYGYDSNTVGFTLAQFQQEIDSGRPVMIHIEGHSMAGYGYEYGTDIIYIHDTWDYSSHQMSWGGQYSGAQHYGVSVFQLAPVITADNNFIVQNIGNANLTIYSVNSNKNWLSLTGLSTVPIILTPNENQQATVVVDWNQITGSQDNATITIVSNDPDNPSVQVQVTAIKAAKSIRLTSPNGGEDWKAGTQQSITWNSTSITNIKIEYTTDGGASWFAPIASSASASIGSYTWTVPNRVSQQCKIKITDTENSSITDMSDNVFTISNPVQPPVITVSTNSLTGFGNVTVNTNSSVQSYTVSGSNLTSNIVVAAPNGFQVSKQNNSGFANSITLNQTGGAVSSTTIYARFTPTTVQNYSGNISHTSTGATTQNVSVSGTGTQESASIKPISSSTTYDAGTEFWVEIKVGDPKPITDLYGISFKLTVDNSICTYVDGSAVVGDFLGSSPIPFTHKVNNQTVEIAVTKTSTPGVNGSGIVAKAKFTSASSISANQTLVFSFFDISATNSQGNAISVTPSTLVITITPPYTLKVWPGDCNNDLVVSGADLLPIGQYYGQSIPSQNNPGSQWQVYERNKWLADNNTPKRIYADANGDGTINGTDVLPIGLHYGKTHSASNSDLQYMTKINDSGDDNSALSNASLNLECLQCADKKIKNNTNFTIQVITGKQVNVTDLFGISFKIKSNKSTCNYVENSFKVGAFFKNNPLPFFHKVDDQTLDAAITKTSPPGDNGNGIIASFDFISSIDQTVEFSLYDVNAIDSQGNSILLDVTGLSINVDVKKEVELPENYSLSQNYPNPFNPSTSISYQIPNEGFVSLKVYDAIGNEIKTLIDEEKMPGSYEIIFDASNLPSGVYYYKMTAGDFVSTKKLMLIK